MGGAPGWICLGKPVAEFKPLGQELVLAVWELQALRHRQGISSTSQSEDRLPLWVAKGLGVFWSLRGVFWSILWCWCFLVRNRGFLCSRGFLSSVWGVFCLKRFFFVFGGFFEPERGFFGRGWVFLGKGVFWSFTFSQMGVFLLGGHNTPRHVPVCAVGTPYSEVF